MNYKEETERLRCWAEIDLSAVEYNFKTIHKRLPPTVKHLAVVKADAYGHGAVKVAKLLEESADYFAVAFSDEAIELRKAGIKKPILILAPSRAAECEAIIENDITFCLSDNEDAENIVAAAEKCGKKAKVHIAIDTGMSRIGYPPDIQTVETIKTLAENKNLEIEGLFSHFAKADCKDKAYAEVQISEFDKVIKMLDEVGVKIPIKHLYNSAATVDLPIKYDMVREGICLYGMYPSPEVNMSNIGGVKCVMSLKAHVSYLKTYPSGIHVSYGCTYTTTDETKIATVCAGYADGVPRQLSNIGKVVINGVKCPIIGRVCMDQFMVDVTAVSDIKKGDVVTIFGEEITADSVAESVGTIGYELTCGINKRVPRVYIRDGKIEEIKKGI